MADPGEANTILKILSGTQSGAEVSLAKGEYLIGSGPDDDIQIIDVSLRPGHAKLRVSPGKIEISAAAGSLKTANGISLDANSGWQEIEPLDTITAGTTRFALGPPTAHWESVTEAEVPAGQERPAPARKKPAPVPPGIAEWLPRGRQLAIPIAALVLLVGFAAWQLSSARIAQFPFGRSNNQSEVELLREALAQLPFAQNVTVRQDVDYSIFVSGYVDAPVERRAVIATVERTGIPARVRVSVLQSIRNEVESLIKSENVSVTATVTPKGEVILDGVILDQAAEAKFVELVKDRLIGVSKIESRIKTAKSLLADVERLAQVSQVSSWILLRNDRDLLEVTGAIPAEKIDAWLGFLQAYAKRYAKDIGLRSFVQLQGVGLGGPAGRGGRPFVIGGRSGPQDGSDIELDVERLQQGMYGSSDVLVGGTPHSIPADVPMNPPPPPAPRNPGPTSSIAPGTSNIPPSLGRVATPASAPAPSAVTDRPDGGTNTPGGTLNRPSQETVPAPSPNNAQAESSANTQARGPGNTSDDNPIHNDRRSAANDLVIQARELLEQWRDNKLGSDANARAFKLALDALASGGPIGVPDGSNLADRYLPLLAVRPTGGSDACWDDSQLTPATIPAVLFWLDLLSVSDAVSLTFFDMEKQALLLEAALNPRRVAKCATKIASDGKKPRINSLYLAEVSRNPEFVRFLSRDLKPFSLDITGASVGPNGRFVQIRSGRKYIEGAAPDRASRLAIVGELGVAIQLKDGMSTIVFGPEINWLAD